MLTWDDLQTLLVLITDTTFRVCSFKISHSRRPWYSAERKPLSELTDDNVEVHGRGVQPTTRDERMQSYPVIAFGFKLVPESFGMPDIGEVHKTSAFDTKRASRVSIP
jgi:hypothetical protein